ncbi:MAG: hypothetical protein ACI4UK_11595 [Floccifex sp.]
MESFDITQALYYLKQNYVLYCLESNVLLYEKENQIVLSHEQWHSNMNIDDFQQSFSSCHFQLLPKQEETISKEKDDEYYQWRFHHQ